MSEQSLLLQLRPQVGRMQEERRWSDSDVKKMLFAFARDLGCKWRRDKLNRVIDKAFGDENKCVTIQM